MKHRSLNSIRRKMIAAMGMVTSVAMLVYVMMCLEKDGSTRKKRGQRSCWVRPWLLKRLDPLQHNTVCKLQRELLDLGDEDEIRYTLRMPPDIYFSLLNKIRGRITKTDTRFRKAIPAEQRFAIFLRYIALGDAFGSLSQQFRVGRCMIGRIIREVGTAIWEELKADYLKTPKTFEGWKVISDGFWNRWNIPHTLGALDGKHIRIRRPKNTHGFFRNYKGYFSLVLLAICDHNYVFRYIDLGAEGKSSDGGIWRQCSLFAWLSQNGNEIQIPGPDQDPGMAMPLPYFFLADDAFALSPFLMKPFPSTGLTQAQLIYNYRVSRGRRCVENGFGILVSKFRVFLRAIEMEPDGAEIITKAAVLLHNMLRELSPSYIRPSFIDQTDAEDILRENRDLDNLEGDHARHPSVYAQRVRLALKDFFLTPEGEVPWQYDHDVISHR